MNGLEPIRWRRLARSGSAAFAQALIVTAAMLIGPGRAHADDDFDRLIGMQHQPVPATFADPAQVTLAPTGIDCYTLPCPYWKVEDASRTLLIGVEAVVASPDDHDVALENGLWALLRDNGYTPLAVEGYVIDRPREQGQPPMQRVLVITEWLPHTPAH